MSFGNNPEKMKNSTPKISYHSFKRKLKSEHPRYNLVKDGEISSYEFKELKEANDRDEYQKKWEDIQEERQREEEYRRARECNDDPRV